ncbi:hypothetical protein, partial [Klebsiella aerogenes]|uniref:hypothetical protein n=1 Tax=Klebsiella aerogenes TaxID=548 RepID=UPI0019536ABB
LKTSSIALAMGSGNTMAAGLMVSFLCYSAGCVYLYRLAACELGKAAARRAVLFLSLFPYLE